MLKFKPAQTLKLIRLAFARDISIRIEGREASFP
jgi:hypothetical protein